MAACVLQLSGSGGGGDPTDEASSTPGNSLFTKALPLCAFGVVTLRFDFLLFKEVCYCHQGFYLITERHQREMKHSGESLEGAFWKKLASSLGWEWLLKFPFLCRSHWISFVLDCCVQESIQVIGKLSPKNSPGISAWCDSCIFCRIKPLISSIVTVMWTESAEWRWWSCSRVGHTWKW